MKAIDPEQRNRLVLFPVDAEHRITDVTGFSSFLHQIGLAHDGKPGAGFMKCLTFLGCSPSLGSNREEGRYNEYSIELQTANTERTLITGARTRAPVCPACGVRDEESLLRDSIIDNGNQLAWHCRRCGRNISLEEFNWRHKLGVATDYVVIHGVYEGEAIPSDKLLDQLARYTGVSWSYSYC